MKNARELRVAAQLEFSNLTFVGSHQSGPRSCPCLLPADSRPFFMRRFLEDAENCKYIYLYTTRLVWRSQAIDGSACHTTGAEMLGLIPNNSDISPLFSLVTKLQFKPVASSLY